MSEDGSGKKFGNTYASGLFLYVSPALRYDRLAEKFAPVFRGIGSVLIVDDVIHHESSAPGP